MDVIFALVGVGLVAATCLQLAINRRLRRIEAQMSKIPEIVANSQRWAM